MQYLSLLRRPVPFSLWAGQTFSTVGDRLYSMAMLWLALQMTGSATMMAITSLFEGVALTLVSLLGGVWADRWSRYATTISIDLWRALLVLTIPSAHALHVLNLWLLISVGVCMGSLEALFDPAFNALLPSLVAKDQFPGLAGLMDTPSRFARLLGPGLAGVILSWLPMIGFFVIDSISFLASAASLALIRVQFGRSSEEGTLTRTQRQRPRLLLEDIKTGVTAVLQDKLLCMIFTMDSIGNFAFVTFTLGGLLFATRQLHIGVGGYGLLIGAYGVGSLVGNFAAGNVDFGRWRSVTAIGGWSGIGLGFVVLGLSHGLLTALFGTAMSGACGALAHVSRATLVGIRVDPRNLGRVYSLLNIVTTIASTTGTLLCGLLLDHWPASVVITGSGTFLCCTDFACVGVFLYILFRGRVRRKIIRREKFL